ncbi:MAG TPA: DUF2141 domain-containing protein [Gammaproteobacteria bacterium]
MKAVLFALPLSFGLLSLTAAAGDEPLAASVPETGNLVVTARFAEPATGIVNVAIYATADNFLRRPVASVEVPLHDGIAEATFTNLAYGEYAVSAYLDLDGDNKLDSVWFGAPAEPVGTSNNARGNFGPPAWEDARFAFATEAAAIAFELHCPVGCD